MRLPDDFEEENGSMGFSVMGMAVGVCVFILLLFLIIVAVNYKENKQSNATEQSVVIQETESSGDQSLKERTDQLVSGSTLRSDDLDFWDMYPETAETQEQKSKYTVEESTESEETKEDPSTDGKHTLVTYASGKEEWVSINPYIKKNKYDTTDLVSQNNIMKYYEGSRLTSKLGVDISKREAHVDFTALVSAGVDFAMIRVGSRGYESGQLMEDDYFAEHVDGALEAGLEVGLYFDSSAVNEEEAREEAQMLLARIGERKITYPIAFAMGFADNDISRIDSLTPAERTEIARAFLEEISNAGYYAMIYGDKEWLIKEIEIAKLGDYDFWLSMPGDLPDYPYSFTIWQYAITGSMDGITGAARINISFIDYSEK